MSLSAASVSLHFKWLKQSLSLLCTITQKLILILSQQIFLFTCHINCCCADGVLFACHVFKLAVQSH